MSRTHDAHKGENVKTNDKKMGHSVSAVDKQPYEFQRGSNVGHLSPVKSKDAGDGQPKNWFAK